MEVPEEHTIEVDPPRCPECGYDLRASFSLAGARCPECGRRSSFDELRFPDPREGRDLALALAVVIGPVLLLLGAKLLWQMVRPRWGGVDLLLFGLAGVSGLLALIGLVWLLNVLWPRMWWRFRGLLTGIVLIDLIFAGWISFVIIVALLEVILIRRVWRWWQRRRQPF